MRCGGCTLLHSCRIRTLDQQDDFSPCRTAWPAAQRAQRMSLALPAAAGRGSALGGPVRS